MNPIVSAELSKISIWAKDARTTDISVYVSCLRVLSITESRAVTGKPSDAAVIFLDGGRLPSWI